MKSDVILENLDSAIILLDGKLNVVRVNIACEDLFGKSRRYLIGENCQSLITSQQVIQRLQQCLSHNTQITLREIKISAPAGDVLVDITLSCVCDESGIHSLVLMELSSINRISRFIKENNLLERQQSFRLMMRGLAHEIKNPLGGIRGAAQLLDRELVNPQLKEYTNILIKEADRLTRLVDRVMGSHQQPRPEILNIHEVLEHVIQLVKVKANQKLIIERIYDPTLPEINADREQLVQVVLNIVGNAIEAQAGTEQVKIGLATRFERFVTINQKIFRRVLKVQIWDQGPGVKDEIKEIIFDPLITGRPEGTGLGLSIAQSIVHQHQGVIQLDDYLGKTCFSFYLPYQEGNPESDDA